MSTLPAKTLRRCTFQRYEHYEGVDGCRFSRQKHYVTLEWLLGGYCMTTRQFDVHECKEDIPD